jgi:hypothetical protein
MSRVNFVPISKGVYIDIILTQSLKGKKNTFVDTFTMTFVAWKRK